MKSQRVFLLAIFLVGITFPLGTFAEQRQVSWTPVTTYSDGTPIGADEVLTYSIYWTDDPWLSPGSLRPLVSSLPETSFPFDPTDAGMPRGQTIYFTAKSVLNTGEQSSLSTATAWNVPVLVPSSPSNIMTTNQAPWQISWDAVTTYTDGTLIGSRHLVGGGIAASDRFAHDRYFPFLRFRACRDYHIPDRVFHCTDCSRHGRGIILLRSIRLGRTHRWTDCSREHGGHRLLGRRDLGGGYPFLGPCHAI